MMNIDTHTTNPNIKCKIVCRSIQLCCHPVRALVLRKLDTQSGSSLLILAHHWLPITCYWFHDTSVQSAFSLCTVWNTHTHTNKHFLICFQWQHSWWSAGEWTIPSGLGLCTGELRQCDCGSSGWQRQRLPRTKDSPGSAQTFRSGGAPGSTHCSRVSHSCCLLILNHFIVGWLWEGQKSYYVSILC